MKRLLWLGLLFLSTSWLFFLPIFTLPDYYMGLLLLIIGIICNILALWKHDLKFDKKYLIILIPLLIFLLLIPFPYSLGPIVLTIGVLLFAIKNYISKNDKANWVFLGISLSGLVLTIQTLFLPLYAIFVSHGHRVDILSHLASSVGGLFGLKTSLNNGIVFVQTYQQTYPFTTTWEKLGFYPWINILIGALVLFFFLPKIKKIGIHIVGFFLLSGVYLILRYVFIVFIFSQTKDVTLFWDPVFLSMSFLPFALLLMRFAPLKNIHFDLDCFKGFRLGKNRAVAIVLVFLFVFSLVGAFVFQDPGTRKAGRILIDELHSDWEDSSRELDKEWYGMLSTYNYYSWAEWLDKYYEVDRNIDQYLTYDLIKNYDILILKCPTNLYLENEYVVINGKQQRINEIADIMRFVEEGGGLYLIGDHTNVFGMNYYLNQVSENFGITFNTDANYELGTGMTSIYKPDPLFPHPVVQNMEQFDFLTSCTLKAPINSENIIIGNRVISSPGTYSTVNFFRESTNTPDFEFGLVLQVAAVKYDKGRVLAFTDSTCFSNFCIFMDGYKAFNLGTMEYLNRVNTYSYLNTVLAGIAIITLVLIMYFLRKEKKAMVMFLFITAGLLSFSIAAPVFSHMNQVNYSLPSVHTDFTQVCFDEEHSDVVIAHRTGITAPHKLFGTFFVWTQRIDCIPSLEKTLEDAINNGDVVVIINPVGSFEEEEIVAITEYVKTGGNVLLMDSVVNTGSTANNLLQSFDITIYREKSSHRLYSLNDTTGVFPVVNESTENTLDNSINLTIGNITSPYLTIRGGENVFVTEKNETSIAVAELGKGRIVVVVDSYTFSDEVMGGTFTEPDEVLMQIYNTEYYIFEELLLEET